MNEINAELILQGIFGLSNNNKNDGPKDKNLGNKKKAYINILRKRILDQLYIKSTSTKNIHNYNNEDLRNALKNFREGKFAPVVDAVITYDKRQAFMYYYSTEMFCNERLTLSLKKYFTKNAVMTIKFSRSANKVEHYRYIKYWDRKKVFIRYLNETKLMAEADIIKLWKGYKVKYIYIDFGVQNEGEKNIKDVMIEEICKLLPHLDIFTRKDLKDFEKNFCKDLFHYYLKNFVIPTLSKLCFKEIYKKAKESYLNSIRSQIIELYDRKPVKNVNILCIVGDYINGCCCRIYDKNEEVVDKFVIYLDSYKRIVYNDYTEIEQKINNLNTEINDLSDKIILNNNNNNNSNDNISNDNNDKNSNENIIYKKKNMKKRLSRKLNKLKYIIELFKDDKKELCNKIKQYDIQLIAMGNGSFSCEIEDLLKKIIGDNNNNNNNNKVKYVILDELIKEKKNLSVEERNELLEERNRSIYDQIVKPFHEYSRFPLEALHYYDNNNLCDIISMKKIKRIITEETDKRMKNDNNNNYYRDINSFNNNDNNNNFSLIPKNFDNAINGTVLCRRMEAVIFNLNLPMTGIYYVVPVYKKYITNLFQNKDKEMDTKKELLKKLNDNYTKYLELVKVKKTMKMIPKKVVYKRLHLSLIEDEKLLEKRKRSMMKRYLYESIPYYTNFELNKKITGTIKKVEKNYCLVKESQFNNIGMLYKDDYCGYIPKEGDKKEFNVLFSAVEQIKLVKSEVTINETMLKNLIRKIK